MTGPVPTTGAIPPLGVVLPQVEGGFDELAEVAAGVERAGAGAVWLTDHLYWHGPAVDVVGALPIVAQATSHCLVGPCVLQLPLRATAATAKSMAYLDHLAPGRVVVGVGVGEHRAEYDAAGLGPIFEHRGMLLDAGIADLRAAWSGGLSSSGPFGSDADGRFTMAPARPLPVWVGGRSERARRRAAALGDGWIPHLCRLDWYAAQMPLLHADLAAAGRAEVPFVRGALLAVSVDGVEPDIDPLAWLGNLYGLDPQAFARVLVRGTADEVGATLTRFRQAGADHLALMVAGHDPTAHLAALS